MDIAVMNRKIKKKQNYGGELKTKRHCIGIFCQLSKMTAMHLLHVESSEPGDARWQFVVKPCAFKRYRISSGRKNSRSDCCFCFCFCSPKSTRMKRNIRKRQLVAVPLNSSYICTRPCIDVEALWISTFARRVDRTPDRVHKIP